MLRTNYHIDLTFGAEYEIPLMYRNGSPAYAADLIIKKTRCKGLAVEKELQQSVLEVITKPYSDFVKANSEILEDLQMVAEIAGEQDIVPYGAGRHPWEKAANLQRTLSNKRYLALLEEFLATSQVNIMTVHPNISGFTSWKQLFKVHDQIRLFLPHMLALTANSPFFEGELAGMATRPSDWYLFVEDFKRKMVPNDYIPIGVPNAFESPKAFQIFMKTLITRKIIWGAKGYWTWLRPKTYGRYWNLFQPGSFGRKIKGLEFRIGDMGTHKDNMAYIAFCCGLVKWIVWQNANGYSFPIVSKEIIEADIRQVMKYGLCATIHDCAGDQISVRDSLVWILKQIEPFLEEMRAEKQLERLWEIVSLGLGTGSERQLAAYEQGGFPAVVDYLTSSFLS